MVPSTARNDPQAESGVSPEHCHVCPKKTKQNKNKKSLPFKQVIISTHIYTLHEHLFPTKLHVPNQADGVCT